MKKALKNICPSLFNAVLKMGLVCLILGLPLPVSSQKAVKEPERTNIPSPENLPKFHSIPKEPFLNHLPFRGPDMLRDSTWLQISFDWTLCQVHRVNDTSPIEIILPGFVNSNSPNIWNLFASEPEPNAAPNLYFVEDILGQTGPAYGTDIPLIWEISLDGGTFVPMTLQPDNTLTTTLPLGPHTFQVRITGTPQPFQEDGYYHLQMSQWIMPEL